MIFGKRAILKWRIVPDILWDITETKKEKAVLIGLDTPNDEVEIEESLSELYQLTRTAGAQVVGKFVQARTTPHPATYVGKGKVEQIRQYVIQNRINLVVTDDEVTPTQERNLEEEFSCKVVDRTHLILDIFALHAASSVGKLQVELAQMEYLLPRLKNIWTEFSRLGAGIGTRGPGEKKIEIDRRIISDRIADIRKRLEKISKQRKNRRRQRVKSFIKTVCLVGYTNSGKSTLLNALTGAKVGIANKLFATLSPTARRFNCGITDVLLVDTVGFIRKLPHQLVEAFMATLEQVQEADLLLHVIDISSENYRHQINAVRDVLGDLKALDKKILRVYNKIDQTSYEPGSLQGDMDAVYISAMEGLGLDALRDGMERMLAGGMERVVLALPQDRQDIINALYESVNIISRNYSGNSVVLECYMDSHVVPTYRRYIRR